MKTIKTTLLLFLLSMICHSQSHSSKMKLKTGMTENEAGREYPNCEFKGVKAWEYGVDGGGNGVEVICNDEILFFYWTHWETKKITGIVLISRKLSIDDDVHVGMNFRDFLKKYPNSKTTIDLLTDKEICYEPKNKYWLEFDTTDEDRIAEYSYENGEPEFLRFINRDILIARISIR